MLVQSPIPSACPFGKTANPPKAEKGRCPFGFAATATPSDTFTESSQFGPSMPIIDGQVQVPSFATVLKRLFVPHKPIELPRLKRSEIGLSAEGPQGALVAPGNQWPGETVHPLFPEFKALSGVQKADAIAHYAQASRRTGKLDDLGTYGITASPQLIVDPVGMRWPFEIDAQNAAARPREKNMHGRGSWGQVQIVPNSDPSKALNYGVLGKGGVGDLRLSLGADQSTNVVGGALGIPLSPNEQGVESANFLMLSGPGPQLDNLDFFAKPLTTVALPDSNTPTLFKILDHGFKASAESGVRPGNHMFRYDQDGHFDAQAAIPAEVQLVPNPRLTLHTLTELSSQNVDGVKGEAVREEFSHLQGEFQGEPLRVLDLALSEALLEKNDHLTLGSLLPLTIKDAEGQELALNAEVVAQTENGTKVAFRDASSEAKAAVYQSMDLIWELGRRIQPGDSLYQIDVKMESGEWKRDVARVQAQSDFFPNEFADHQRLYAHTERPNRTPILRKMLNGIRWATGNIAEAVATCPFA